MAAGVRVLVASALAVLLGAGAWAVSQGERPTADPVRAVFDECGGRATTPERRCYEEKVLQRLRAGGVPAALGLLDRLAELDPDVRRDGHMYAHGIGIAALGSPTDVGRVFASCTPGWQSGCYHGVLQSYFLHTRRGGAELSTANVDALCGAYRGTDGNPWLLFQCTHGMGHGLAMYHDHDLPRALASCDLLSRRVERENCHGGAFMENIVNVTHPHQMAAGAAGGDHSEHRGQDGPRAAASPGDYGEHDGHGSTHGGGHDAYGGHGAAQSGSAQAWRPLDPNDLHYPCSVMDEKYLEGCYQIQTAAMLWFTRQDVGRAAQECARAPDRFRRTCFISLGRDVSSMGGLREAARLCGLAAPEYEPICNEGVAQSVINMNADMAEGVAYCRLLASAQSKRACYSITGRQALLLPDGGARRERACLQAEEGYADICLGRTASSGWGATNAATVSARRR